MINKINPLYILAFCLTLFIISFFELSTTKDELNKKYSNFNEFKKEIKEFNTLNATWNKKDLQKKINSITSLSNQIEYKNYKSKIVFTLSSSDNSLKQRFINKVLNNNLKIEKFDIKKDIIVFEIGNRR